MFFYPLNDSKLSESMDYEWCENPYYYKVLSKYFNALDCLQNLKQTFERSFSNRLLQDFVHKVHKD